MLSEDENQNEQDLYMYKNKISGISARYLLDTRKKYLLNSNVSSVQQLLENQENKLSEYLIELKREEDLINRDLRKKQFLCDEYNKKIASIMSVDAKTKVKMDQAAEENEELADAVSIKKNKKEEEAYLQKTLKKQVDKLTNDIILIKNQIVKEEIDSQLLDKMLEFSKLDSNKIKSRKNNLHSKIEGQKSKNKLDKKEQNYKINYYNTIINQKFLFMQLEDERKKIQKEIREKAKMDTLDREEVNQRNKLHLFYLYNQYLKEKLKRHLKKYEKTENVFNEIRNICGTSDLNKLAGFLTGHEKNYTECVREYQNKEKRILRLNNEIKRLKAKLSALKSEVIVEEDADTVKSITAISSTHISEDELKISEKYENLKVQLGIVGEKVNEVDLVYKKVIENIIALDKYDKEHPLKSLKSMKSPKKDKEERKLNLDEDKTEEVQEKEADKKTQKETEKEGKEINDQKEDDIEGNNERNGTNNNGEIVELTEEENEYVKTFSSFIDRTLKAFDILFLIRSKKDFIKMMEDKGKELEKKEEEKRGNLRENTRYGNKKKTNRLCISVPNRPSKQMNKPIKVRSFIFAKNEEEDKEEQEEDSNIMAKFLRQQRKAHNDFIYNRKDDKNKKRK